MHSIIACRVILDIRGQTLDTDNVAWLDTPPLEQRPIPEASDRPTSPNADGHDERRVTLGV